MKNENDYYLGLCTEEVCVVSGDLDIPKRGRWFNAPIDQISNSVRYLVPPLNVLDIIEGTDMSSNGIPHTDALGVLIKDNPGCTFIYVGGDTLLNDNRSHWDNAVSASKKE